MLDLVVCPATARRPAAPPRRLDPRERIRAALLFLELPRRLRPRARGASSGGGQALELALDLLELATPSAGITLDLLPARLDPS